MKDVNMSIIHDVKAMRQPSNSDICGQICVRMVLDCLGVKVSLEDVNKLIRYTRGGTLDASLGVALHKSGAKLNMFVLPGDEAFPAKYAGMLPKEVATHLLKRARRVKSKMLRRGYTDLAYLFERNLITFEPPTPSVLKREITSGGIWIVGVDLGSFYTPAEDGHHFVIVRGFKDDTLVINDPGKGTIELNEERLAYSLARSDGIAICVNVTNPISDVPQPESY